MGGGGGITLPKTKRIMLYELMQSEDYGNKTFFREQAVNMTKVYCTLYLGVSYFLGVRHTTLHTCNIQLSTMLVMILRLH